MGYRQSLWLAHAAVCSCRVRRGTRLLLRPPQQQCLRLLSCTFRQPAWRAASAATVLLQSASREVLLSELSLWVRQLHRRSACMLVRVHGWPSSGDVNVAVLWGLPVPQFFRHLR